MTEFDSYTRSRLTYDRFKWLSALAGGSIVFLLGFMENFNQGEASPGLLTLGLVGLAFTLFVSIGVQVVAAAADRWQTEAVSPALLVWEWRLLALAHLAYLVSTILLVTYLLNNLRAAV